jgi:hypothetical protein
MNQGMLATSRSWKKQGNGFFSDLPEGTQLS